MAAIKSIHNITNHWNRISHNSAVLDKNKTIVFISSISNRKEFKNNKAGEIILLI